MGQNLAFGAVHSQLLVSAFGKSFGVIYKLGHMTAWLQRQLISESFLLPTFNTFVRSPVFLALPMDWFVRDLWWVTSNRLQVSNIIYLIITLLKYLYLQKVGERVLPLAETMLGLSVRLVLTLIIFSMSSPWVDVKLSGFPMDPFLENKHCVQQGG